MFKQIILDNQELITNIRTFKRNYVFYEDLLKLNKIVSFVGPRRVGKTFLMFDFVKELINKELLDIRQVVFIDFSIYTNEIIDPNILLSNFKELFQDKEPFFIFDEVQDITNFKEFILYFYNLGYKIFLSGSNSKLLSSELSTHFRGRVFEYKILPLTFREILGFKNIEIKNNYSTVELASLKNLLNETLEFGNFPEMVLSENNMFKIENLKTYLDILIYKDLIERYRIENETSLKYMLKNISNSYSKIINLSKIYNELKSLNIKVGKTTIYEYYEYLKNVFFAIDLDNFYNPKAFKKIFLYNIGFNKLYGSRENLGQSFENLVFLELLKKYEKINFKKNGSEIDFYIPEIKTNIQVCYHLDNSNFKRETDPLRKNMEKNILVYCTKDQNLSRENEFDLIDFFDFALKF